ncbi:YhfG family protein [Pseudomonas sp. MH2]|uniref:YhfG family protein n=1 Tax=Pseudomonas machongensis TaxID=3110229 RepID=A0ABU5VJ98_9PSED|nr:YhfG family protein [Pseudomonas sp. MH2]MEA5673022.1 YhfG family protein [Pseudomonas sp. MH2]
MKGISLETKKAVWEKNRRSNYAASLRLEGFDVTPDSAERKLPSKEELLRHYRKQD